MYWAIDFSRENTAFILKVSDSHLRNVGDALHIVEPRILQIHGCATGTTHTNSSLSELAYVILLSVVAVCKTTADNKLTDAHHTD